MKVKFLIQILLLLFASITLFSAIYFYSITNIDKSSMPKLIKEENKHDESLKNSSIDNDNSTSNVLRNMVYENFDNRGNRYEIYADTSEFKDINSKKIFMKGVRAKINLDNMNFITISSEEAIFDNESLTTNFSKNVILDYLNHNIKGESLELLFDKNLITMKDQIIYKNIDTELVADQIIIDLITKDSKIFMNDKNRKIKILNKN
tara:strand:+ start:418 stop:1035 length:618 start_codon:yes stop_codon:yes gene_type:complete